MKMDVAIFMFYVNSNSDKFTGTVARKHNNAL